MPTYNAYAAKSAKGPLEPFTFDPGELGPEEVEIKVTHCGLCHSDLSMLDNDWGMTKFPFVPGHEVTGIVSALGEEAKGLKVGQKVGLGWSSFSCLSCHECLSGAHHLCATVQGTILGRQQRSGPVLATSSPSGSGRTQVHCARTKSAKPPCPQPGLEL